MIPKNTCRTCGHDLRIPGPLMTEVETTNACFVCLADFRVANARKELHDAEHALDMARARRENEDEDGQASE